MKAQFKYAVAETVKHIANQYNLTNEQVMAKIEEGKNRIADEFTMMMVMTAKAMA
jgi:hypothetical protein